MAFHYDLKFLAALKLIPPPRPPLSPPHLPLPRSRTVPSVRASSLTSQSVFVKPMSFMMERTASTRPSALVLWDIWPIQLAQLTTPNLVNSVRVVSEAFPPATRNIAKNVQRVCVVR
uniref:Uncharacterized protein n=1 Tax=Cacopsylla melanoneura TaxID=428564 RepID=A0A8D8LA45_9HEMI